VRSPSAESASAEPKVYQSTERAFLRQFADAALRGDMAQYY
jgi:hypothetical protein